MPAFDWKSLVKQVAPTIGTALGGPLAGAAVKALAGSLLGQDGSEDEVSAALASASPDQLLALKKADQDFSARMKELDIDVFKIDAGDRDSARRREVSANDSLTPRVLAVAITLGFFGVLYYVITHGISDGSGGTTVAILVGSLGTAWTGIVSYYFGSSAGSTAKSAQIANMTAK